MINNRSIKNYFLPVASLKTMLVFLIISIAFISSFNTNLLNSNNNLNPMITLVHSIDFQQWTAAGKLIYWAGPGGAVLVLHLSSKAVRGLSRGQGPAFLLQQQSKASHEKFFGIATNGRPSNDV
jgi:hypothetical protein